MAGTGAKQLVKQLEFTFKELDNDCDVSGARNSLWKENQRKMAKACYWLARPDISKKNQELWIEEIGVLAKEANSLAVTYQDDLNRWDRSIKVARRVFDKAEKFLDGLSGTEAKPRIMKIMTLFGKLGATIETNKKACKKMTSLLKGGLFD